MTTAGRIRRLHDAGVSVWLDDLSRPPFRDGFVELARLSAGVPFSPGGRCGAVAFGSAPLRDFRGWPTPCTRRPFDVPTAKSSALRWRRTALSCAACCLTTRPGLLLTCDGNGVGRPAAGVLMGGRDDTGEAGSSPRLGDADGRETVARIQQDTDQTAADLDQSLADADQGASDVDQQASDEDQASSDQDQHASDRDQAAADREERDGSDPAGDRARAQSREEREDATDRRESTTAGRAQTTRHRFVRATQRDQTAEARDRTAAARDRVADARDRAAQARERAAEARERLALEHGDLDMAAAALRSLRFSGAAARRQAAAQRRAAAADRQAAAADREGAAADRRRAGLDELTGVYRRGIGEFALTQEIARARRSGSPLVVAMIDVDGLKAVNDTRGHGAGDRLLHDVAAAIVSTMRAYDVTVRWGGDEFVCALADMTEAVAADRIADIRGALRVEHPTASISVGLAHLDADSTHGDAGETLDALIARADSALYAARRPWPPAAPSASPSRSASVPPQPDRP